jgi:hypothetical protein
MEPSHRQAAHVEQRGGLPRYKLYLRSVGFIDGDHVIARQTAPRPFGVLLEEDGYDVLLAPNGDKFKAGEDN